MNKKSNNVPDYPDMASENGRLTVKELPEFERPYEKCEKFGPQVLSDAELLAVIIRTGSERERSVELAYRMLNLLPAYNGKINSLYHLNMQKLMSLRGVGKVKAVQIMCVAELSKRMSRAEAESKACFVSAEDTAMYYMEDLRHLEYEQTVAMFLDVRMKLIYDRMMFKGSVSASIFEPRDILVEALKANASNIIMLHNHPTGDPTPSTMDLASTKRLRNACADVGLRLYDHIVIGGSRYVSMRESGML